MCTGRWRGRRDAVDRHTSSPATRPVPSSTMRPPAVTAPPDGAQHRHHLAPEPSRRRRRPLHRARCVPAAGTATVKLRAVGVGRAGPGDHAGHARVVGGGELHQRGAGQAAAEDDDRLAHGGGDPRAVGRVAEDAVELDERRRRVVGPGDRGRAARGGDGDRPLDGRRAGRPRRLLCGCR